MEEVLMDKYKSEDIKTSVWEVRWTVVLFSNKLEAGRVPGENALE